MTAKKCHLWNNRPFRRIFPWWFNQIDENQQKDLSHIISGYKDQTNNNSQLIVVDRQRTPQSHVNINEPRPALTPLYLQQQNQLQSSQVMSVGPVGGACFPLQSSWHQHMATASVSTTIRLLPSASGSTTYTNCTIQNFYNNDRPQSQSPVNKKRRRAFIIASD